MRRAYWTGIRRWACSMKITAATITRPMASTTPKSHQPCDFWTSHSAAGKVATTWQKIRIDMPLPTPRSVISSPSHMMTAVPAVIVITMVRNVEVDSSCSSGSSHCSRLPERASATMPVACRTESPSVRYRVYWVIFVWPAWPSFFSASSRGITTTSSCRMMLAVM